MKEQSLSNFPKEFFALDGLTNSILKKGEILFKEGDSVKDIFFLQEGELSIIVNNLMAWQVFKNEFIGISAYFMDENNYSSTVKAIKTSSIIKIPFTVFADAINKHPKLNSFLLLLFNNRINFIFEKIKLHANVSCKNRLVNLILDKAEKMNNSTMWFLNYSSQDIVEFIGVSQQNALKILNQLQENKLIIFNSDKIEIIDYKGLEVFAAVEY